MAHFLLQSSKLSFLYHFYWRHPSISPCSLQKVPLLQFGPVVRRRRAGAATKFDECMFSKHCNYHKQS